MFVSDKPKQNQKRKTVGEKEMLITGYLFNLGRVHKIPYDLTCYRR